MPNSSFSTNTQVATIADTQAAAAISTSDIIEAKADKTELATKTDLTNIAEEYDNTSTYAVGDVVIYEGQVYKCKTAVNVAEDFDNTKWDAKNIEEVIKENQPDLSNYVTLNGNQTITGPKIFDSNIYITRYKYIYGRWTNGDFQLLGLNNNIELGDPTNLTYVQINASKVIPYDRGSGNVDLGTGTGKNRWRDLYLSRNLTDGTNSISVANIVNKQDALTFATDNDIDNLFN